mgnify:CR=1 FL=1
MEQTLTAMLNKINDLVADMSKNLDSLRIELENSGHIPKKNEFNNHFINNKKKENNDIINIARRFED